MSPLSVGIERLPHAADLALPTSATADAAGFDLRAAVTEPLVLASMARAAVPTGLVLAIPSGFEGQVRPRSGLALRHGVTVANAPGTIDADYRGELKVLLINLGDAPFVVERGQRIAQIVFAPALKVAWDERPTRLETTGRGAGGFGSTGSQSDVGGE